MASKKAKAPAKPQTVEGRIDELEEIADARHDYRATKSAEAMHTVGVLRSQVTALQRGM